MSQRERLYLLAFACITILFLGSVTFAHDDVVTPSTEVGLVGRGALLPVAFVACLDVHGLPHELDGVGSADRGILPRLSRGGSGENAHPYERRSQRREAYHDSLLARNGHQRSDARRNVFVKGAATSKGPSATSRPFSETFCDRSRCSLKRDRLVHSDAPTS